MDSYSLLRSTQEAVGKTQLTDKHDKLMAFSETVQQLEYSLKSSESSINTSKQQLSRLERDVNNHLEREKMKERLSLLAGKKGWFVYLKSLDAFTRVKTELNQIKTKKQEEERQLAPMRKSVQTMESRLVKLKQEMVKLRGDSVAVSKSIKKRYEEECDRVDLKVNEINGELAAREEEERGRLRRYEAACCKYDNLKMELDAIQARPDLDGKTKLYLNVLIFRYNI
jgi:chromosome segregation ATPase